jgi:hypothetical protein
MPGDGSVNAYKDANGDLRKMAPSAGTPTGYRKEFTDAAGSTQQIGYLTYKNIEDGSYNVQQCADFCDSEKFCLGFNIYYERDPKYNPAQSCTSPEPFTNVKCSIFGYPVAKASATNEGQWREQFQVVIVGSNGTYSHRCHKPMTNMFKVIPRLARVRHPSTASMRPQTSRLPSTHLWRRRAAKTTTHTTVCVSSTMVLTILPFVLQPAIPRPNSTRNILSMPTASISLATSSTATS